MKVSAVLVLFFITLLAFECKAQGYFEWSQYLVNAHVDAECDVIPIDGSDILKVYTYDRGTIIGPGSTSESIKVINNNVLAGNLNLPYATGLDHFQVDSQKQLFYDDGFGNVKKYSSSFVNIANFTVIGKLVEVDLAGNLYTYDNAKIRRYDNYGLFLDDVIMPNLNLFFRENGTYYNKGAQITYYKYPNTFIGQISNPSLSGYTRRESRSFNYFLFQNNTNFVVKDSTGQVYYSINISSPGASNKILIDDLGQIILIKETGVLIYNQNGLVKNLYITIPPDNDFPARINTFYTGKNNSIYYSGQYTYYTTSIPSNSYYGKTVAFIPPNIYRTETGTVNYFTYHAFSGKLNTGFFPDSSKMFNLICPLINQSICAGEIELTFKSNFYSYSPQTMYFAEISDSAGDFTNSINIGTGIYPTFKCTIPDNLPTGQNYRIRGGGNQVPSNLFVVPQFIPLLKTPSLSVEYLTGVHGFDPLLTGNFFLGCNDTILGIIHSNSTDINYSWRYRNPYNQIVIYSYDTLINFVQNTEALFAVVQDTISGCSRQTHPIRVSPKNYHSPEIEIFQSSYNYYRPDTFITCLNSGPIRLNFIGHGYVEAKIIIDGIEMGFFYEKYIFPDSIGLGWHECIFEYVNCNAICAPCSDKLMIYVDTCSAILATGNINSGNVVCMSDTLFIPFTTTATFDSSNVFSVYYGGTKIGSGLTSPIAITQRLNILSAQFSVNSSSPYIRGTPNSDGPLRIHDNIRLREWSVGQDDYATCATIGTTISTVNMMGSVRIYRDSILILDSINNPRHILANMPGDYYYEIIDYYTGCTYTSRKIKIVDSLDLPTVLISINSGSASICLGDSTQLSAQSSLPVSYLWYMNWYPVDSTINSSFLSAKRQASYYCEVSTPSGCRKKSNIITLTEHPRIDEQYIATDTLKGCLQSGFNIRCYIPENFNYQWYLNNNPLNVTTNYGSFLATQAGNYYVSVSDSIGCSYVSSEFYLDLKTEPILNIAGPDSVNFCEGEYYTLSLNSSPVHQIEWFSLSGTSIMNDMSTYIAPVSGYYFAKARSLISDYENPYFATTCYNVSDTVFVNYLPRPSVSILQGTGASICDSDSMELSVNFDSTQTWNWYHDGNLINGANMNSIFISQPGVYTASATNIYGCSTVSEGFNLSYLQAPIASATALGNTTFCQGDSVSLRAQFYPGYTYQWYNGHYLIPGAVNQIYKAKTAGNYRVEVTNSQG
ncbi:MAG: hypothetical protein IPI23_03845 [Bacteroidetes bacterium]|nr:hypothetical protein [Bacteroidota bacterium]